jgi:hypothetical protein
MNNTPKLFLLNQELKTLSRVLLSRMLLGMPHDTAVTTRIYVALTHKAFLKVDVDGGANNFVQIATITGVIGLTD